MRWPLVFVLIIPFSMPFSVGSAMAEAGDRLSIAGDNVNLRRGPGSEHEIKRQLSRDQGVIERGREDEWHHVEVIGADGLLGWVHRSLLSADQDNSEGLRAAVSAVKEDEKIRSAVMESMVQPAQSSGDLIDPDVALEEMRSYIKRREKLPEDPTPPRVGQSGREVISPVPIRNPGDQSRVPTELVLASSSKITGIDIEAMEHFRDSVSYLNSRAWSVAGIKLFSEIEPVGGGIVQVKTTDEWFEVPSVGQASYLSTLVDRWSSAKADGAPAGVMLVDPKGDLLMHQTKP